jgi:hypothetical protein
MHVVEEESATGFLPSLLNLHAQLWQVLHQLSDGLFVPAPHGHADE